MHSSKFLFLVWFDLPHIWMDGWMDGSCKLLEHEDAFDVLYCIAFEMMDAQWLAMRASYMQFKVS